MQTIQEKFSRTENRPIRILQFGEGNFLRAFADYMVDIANEKSNFNAGIAIVKPISFGSLERFDRQNNLYTVILRGKENGTAVNRSRVITSVEKALDCEQDFEVYESLAELESLRFIISNTTEAGITLDLNDRPDGLPATYPGKLTKFLYRRYCHFKGAADKGLILLPVELIEDNGKKLKECVLALAKEWGLPVEFTAWIENANVFCSTLVDRIVTGYPKEEAETICRQLGYKDELLDVGEPFGLWVIESEQDISSELPFDKLGLPVVFTKNQRPYRERKVRVLNGAHTASVLMGYLYGLNIVRDCMQDKLMGEFIRRTVGEEIVPLIQLPQEEVKAFAESVFERFENPFIDHQLLSISLNSVSKWKARVLPSFKDYYKTNGRLPEKLTFSFAALLAFYASGELTEEGLVAHRADGTAYTVHDNRDVLEFFAQNSQKAVAQYVSSVAESKAFWGEDLTAYPGFAEKVSYWLEFIQKEPAAALQAVLEK